MLPLPDVARRRICTSVVMLVCVAVFGAVFTPVARAGRYTVVQCDPASRAFADADFERRNGGDYGFAHRCEEDEDASSLQIYTITTTPQNHFGRISWAAPTGARIIGIGLEARLRSDAGQQARLSFLDTSGAEIGRIAIGSGAAGGFERYERQLADGGRERFAASLTCVDANGCRPSEQAKTWVRSIRLVIDDLVPPSLTVSGSLLAPGWHRGSGDVAASAIDAGSGVRRIEVGVGLAPLPPSKTFPCSVVAGSALVTRMRPCAGMQTVNGTLDTASAPFADGANLVWACAQDYGADGEPGCSQWVVMVDNTAPSVAFAAAQDREDPELIRATVADATSGVASGSIAYRPVAGGAWRELPTELTDGELNARVDSSSEPKGRYVFRATTTDAAGNVAVSDLRRDGEEMLLEFPLREGTSLSASIGGRDHASVDYGGRVEVAGVLRDGRGRPIAGEPVDMIERFAGGSSLEPVSRTERTDQRGRYAFRSSSGPSRRIAVSYPGSRRYLDSAAAPIRLGVRGSATLSVSSRHVKAGGVVVFSGAVGRFGAQLPADGKLVELQVRGGGIHRYRTVRRAFHTDDEGRWRTRYGFERFYDRPTRFRFRLEVPAESRWPYLEPTRSRARSLTVTPR